MNYDTKILPADSAGIAAAAEILKNGGIAALPTETVYGLAADALNEDAVRSVYAAKGRPSDNPMIVHIAQTEDIYKYARDIPPAALKMAEAFWPGPLTMVLKKRDIIPLAVSGGLDTVGLRLPANAAAREVITACGRPLAAPSANLSGSPSPTRLSHVIADMNGRIPAILDGGDCAVGVESTVVCFEGEGVCVLRPGFISVEDIGELGLQVTCAKGVTEQVDSSEKVLSPGMKYKHYSPRADVVMVEGDSIGFARFMEDKAAEDVCAMISDSDYCIGNTIKYGDTSEEQARMLFGALREADDKGYRRVYARAPQKNGVGLAVYNRLLRAAGFEVIRL